MKILREGDLNVSHVSRISGHNRQKTVSLNAFSRNRTECRVMKENDIKEASIKHNWRDSWHNILLLEQLIWRLRNSSTFFHLVVLQSILKYLRLKYLNVWHDVTFVSICFHVEDLSSRYYDSWMLLLNFAL